MKNKQPHAIRVLLVDDEESILELYQKVLHEPGRNRSPGRMGQLAAQLFGRKLDDEADELRFELSFARQAPDAVRQVEKGLKEKNPFAVIFMDIRMPPGPDGVWAAEQIRALDPMVEFILVTGFSDLDPKEIARRVPPLDKLLYAEKPLCHQEIRHFAAALGAKWENEQELRRIRGDLEELVSTRTGELEETNRRLIAEIAEHERTEMLREFRGSVLERLAAGESLRKVVSALTTGMACISPEMVCAVLLPNQDLTHLHALPSPGLPDYFLQVMTGLAISADGDPIGRAAQSKLPLAVEQLKDQAGEVARLAQRAGLAGCFVRPILTDDQLLGVLAVFFKEARGPSAFELRLIDSAVQLMTIAIERHKDEGNLHKLLAAVDQNPTALMITNPHGVVEYTNQRYTELTGFLPGEVAGKVADLLRVTGGEGDRAHQRLGRLNKGEKWEGEVEGMSRDGKVYHEQIVISPIKGDDGNNCNLLIMRQDITDRKGSEEERKQLESRLLQAQKMETIGTLAGGIAHDFNNMLTPILGYTEMAMAEVEKDDEVHAHLAHVIRASGRAKELVQQMLTFSRRDQSEREPIKINLVVQEALKLLRAGLPTTLHIDASANKDCGLVKANPTQLIQVIMNLCANAKHAMRQEGGTITVSLEQLDFDDIAQPEHRSLDPGRYALLTIGDTGQGVGPENVSRIFEPFFTTKPAGEGTGLGLSVVHGIVTAHNGEVFVESVLGEGTTFYIYLPVTSEELILAGKEDAAAGGRKEHILFVDDEEMIVHMTSGMLERQGYVVTSATDPREALALFEQNPTTYQLIITDQTMPHLTGVELAARIKTKRPDLPIILLTGFSEAVNEDNCVELGIREFLMKPMSTHELTRAIRKVLDA